MLATLRQSSIDERRDGIYDVPEAAGYLRASSPGPLANVTSRQLIRWIRNGYASRALTETPGRDLLIEFEDLISMRVIAALRFAGVSFPKIKVAESSLRKMTGAQRPFATEMVWTDRSDVFSELKSTLIAASKHGQFAMELMREHLVPVAGLRFDADGVADRWSPRDSVVLDPEIQFGAPCIRGTRIPTRTIWGMVRAGDSIERLADSFRIEVSDVKSALEWEESASVR